VLLLAAVEGMSHAVAGEDAISGPLAEQLFGYPRALAGRTSLATATGLFLIAGSVLAGDTARGAVVRDCCAGLAAMLSGLAVVAYLYGVQDLYAFGPFHTMALLTAGALFLLSMASLLVRTNRGWAAVIASDLVGGGSTRRQITLTLLMPLAGWLLLQATNVRSVGPALAMSLLVSLMVVSMSLLILRDGRIRNELDAERRSRSAVLAEAKAELERDLAARIAALDEANRERLKAEEALRQSQKMEAIGQLTGGVAHDFNNLLTVLQSSVDLLKRPNLTEERRQRYITAISNASNRAAKLTAQLLAFARRQALKPEVFDVAESIRAIADMIIALTGSRIRIDVRLPDEPCFVNADASQFDTSIVNLAANARDAMDGHGTLTIEVGITSRIPPLRAHPPVDGEFVTIAVSDTGSGIAEDNIERIFEPFFTTKRIGKGTGLGLSQVFGFVKQSGGEVGADSEVGRGTRFTLYLPRVPRPVFRATSPEDGPPVVDGHGTCVLVVEDNADVGSFAAQTLEELGYQPVLAHDAETALAELEEDASRFDVVFSDVVMPGMSGIELGERIRQGHADLPVVLTSGYSHILAQDGAHGFELLHKPYSIEQLSRVLQKAAQWRRLRRALDA
jgi:signal transduction histidine kinase/ActR/RegA family two-component response regulator